MVNLVKGQKVELTKSNPGLTKINAGLGWDVNAFDSGSQFDLDAEVFLLGDNVRRRLRVLRKHRACFRLS